MFLFLGHSGVKLLENTDLNLSINDKKHPNKIILSFELTRMCDKQSKIKKKQFSKLLSFNSSTLNVSLVILFCITLKKKENES